VLEWLLSGSGPRAALAEGGLLDGLKKALTETTARKQPYRPRPVSITRPSSIRAGT
jgi:hypothetical protein